ncbi:hypothetical protein SASPL_152821 [Salvia splendens]|uniref:(Z)-3-hexen-1-ol acetyltransferase n=1 Tax=Salvia splendens TaxID=180675 RepID=A0A8X8Z1A4_SALSN|nr:hypothetical protein SASPL_152821 [Salvia splendens]
MIAPAKPSPHEFKVLSDIDDQEGLRFQIPTIQFYRRNLSSKERDPVKVIRDAISYALVYYYPFAGRLREHTNRKLVVECNEEGVALIEADADVALQQLGDSLYPPFPYLDKLLHHLPATAGIINCPLLLIQVTRLKCGGFVLATRLNHTMSDAAGLVQFMSAVGEFARGNAWPSIQPVWERHLLSALNPPRFPLHSGGHLRPPPQPTTASPRQLQLRDCDSLHLAVSGNLPLAKPRGRDRTLVLSECSETIQSASPGGHAVELLRNAKSQAVEEYVKSVADLMVTRGRPCFKTRGIYLVSDVTRAGLGEVDYGWGTAEYDEPALCGIDLVPGVVSFAIPYKNIKGEKGIRLTMSLPPNAMDKFINEPETAMAAACISLFVRESAL